MQFPEGTVLEFCNCNIGREHPSLGAISGGKRLVGQSIFHFRYWVPDSWWDFHLWQVLERVMDYDVIGAAWKRQVINVVVFLYVDL